MFLVLSGSSGKSVDQSVCSVQFECFYNFSFQISKVGVSVAIVFFVTLAAFPSLTSRIQSVNKKDGTEWTSK